MFKKFSRDEVASSSQMKSSDQRKVRKQLVASYPLLEEHLETIFPKKSPMLQAKCPGHISLLLDQDDVIWFFAGRNGVYIPTLRTLHRFPDIMPKLQVDRGAIKFVLGGANIMCPGLTSAGGRMDDVPTGTNCAIYAEDKEHALAIGVTTMSTEEIREQNKGIGVEVLHHLNDGLWKTPSLG